MNKKEPVALSSILASFALTGLKLVVDLLTSSRNFIRSFKTL